MRPVGPVERKVANIYSAEFRPFVFEDGVTMGDSVLQLDEQFPLGVGFHIYRMPPGMTSRPHRHNGSEQFLILDGELIDNDGTVFRKGDMVWFKDGTEHSSYTPTGCLLAVHITELETTVE